MGCVRQTPCATTAPLPACCVSGYLPSKRNQEKNELFTLIREFKLPQVALARYVFGFCARWSIWGPRTARQRHLNSRVAGWEKGKGFISQLWAAVSDAQCCKHQEIKRPNELKFFLVTREKSGERLAPRRIVAFVLGLDRSTHCVGLQLAAMILKVQKKFCY